ncbi:MAG: protein-L-isoaspartate(D-aspartate) O-methyltransferase, partial [Planctomycetota bacterium]
HRTRIVVTLNFLIVTCALTAGAIAQNRRFDELRDDMVTAHIEGEGITNTAVLQAMRAVPRHEFVPSAQRGRAYEDLALPIGHQQTISPPYIVAYMTNELDPQPNDRVLEIGTGSGYQASVLAQIVKDVYTIEIVSELSKQAEKRMQDLGYMNVHCLDGDGFKGWPEHAPFDKIIVTCSPENIPLPLIDQLKDGGRMIIPVGERYQQSFHLLVKENGKLKDERLASTLFVPMTGESEVLRRVQPDPDRPQIVNGSFDLDENEDEKPDGWHYQRQTTMCDDAPMDGKYCLRFENKDSALISQALQGSAINGRTVGTLRLNYWVRCNGIVPGSEITQQAAVVVHFYDNFRREVGTTVLGKWRGSFGWQNARSTVIVPSNAKELIIRIGLNGAQGQLDLDDLQMTAVKR